MCLKDRVLVSHFGTGWGLTTLNLDYESSKRDRDKRYKSLIEYKNIDPLICSITFHSTTSVDFIITGQRDKCATSSAVGTKRLSLSGNYGVKWNLFYFTFVGTQLA